MSGEIKYEVRKIIKKKQKINERWDYGIEEMKDELKMEDKVNRKISEIIEDCEDKNGDGSGVND